MPPDTATRRDDLRHQSVAGRRTGAAGPAESETSRVDVVTPET